MTYGLSAFADEKVESELNKEKQRTIGIKLS